MVQKNSLGKGLASLIPTTVDLLAVTSQEDKELSTIDVNQIQWADGFRGKEAVESKPVPNSSKEKSRSENQKNQSQKNDTVHLQSSENAAAKNTSKIYGITLIPIQDIEVNPYQPRREFNQEALEELSQSIAVHGVIQPLVVRKVPGKGYELIAGERRLRASKLAGLTQVPVVLRQSTDKESLQVALIENIQREELNCVDTAVAYFSLIQDFGLTQEQIAEKVGKSRSQVANSLRLLQLPEEIVEDLKKQKLSFGHAKALLMLDQIPHRLEMRANILEKGWSVRELERQIEQLKRKIASEGEFGPNESVKLSGVIESEQAVGAKELQAGQEISSGLDLQIKKFQLQLSRFLGTKVRIQGDEQGKVVIHFHSVSQLHQIIEKITFKNL